MAFDSAMAAMLLQGFWETLFMTFASSFFAYLIGIPLGIILVVMDKGGIRPLPWLQKLLGLLINLLRSVPFLILMIMVLPFARKIVGTSLGPKAVVVALVIAAAPYVARVVESSFKEVDAGVIEAAQSMGASTFQIIWKVLLPEAKPSLLVGAAISITTILGYSAMAGIIGGGGLGDIAIKYGYYRFDTQTMTVTVIVLIIIVQIIQESIMKFSKVSDKRIR